MVREGQWNRDMAKRTVGTGMTASDRTSASLAALRQQVAGVVDDYDELSDIVGKLASEMRQGFAALNNKLDNQMTPKWGVILAGLSLVLSIMMALGALAYLPIKSENENLKAALARQGEQNLLRDNRMWDEIVLIARKQAYIEGQLHPLK